MSGFVESLKIGMSASKDAVNNFAAIREVFKRLRYEIAQETDDVIKFDVVQYNGFGPELANFYMDDFIPEDKNDLYQYSLLLSTGDLNKGKDMMIIGLSLDGFPCSLQWDKTRYLCESKDELELSIKEFLSDPDIGRAIYVMLNRADKS